MHDNWTRGLNEKSKEQGNTFMVRERLRWTLFQAIIAGLQPLPILQVTLLTLLDLAYLVILFRESTKSKIFESIFLQIKVVVQECAIFTFLVVLNIFAFAKDPNTRTSQLFGLLEIIVVVAVFVAIACELIVIFNKI